METTDKTKSFSELISQDHPVLVDFSADWCGPCKMMKPILEEVKQHTQDKLTIIKIDVDRSPQAANAYGIQGVPTLILFKNNKILWRQSGVVPAKKLEEIIQPYL